MKKLSYLFALLLTLSFGTAQAQRTCVANFQYSVSGLTVNFLDSSAAPAIGNLTYSWSFGDGNSSTLQHPNHTYSQAGTYTTCLIISTSLGCFDSTCVAVTVGNVTPPGPCSASFSYSTSGNAVSFTNTSASTPAMGYTYSWNFGDGAPLSTSFSPTHTYSMSGIYVASLTASGAGSSCTYYDTVVVNSSPAPCNAQFTYLVGANGSVSFTNQSTGINALTSNFFWNFGDGSSSSTASPTHTYTTAGTYTVILNIVDSMRNCFSSYSDSVVIQIAPPSPCNASFTKAKDSTVAFGVIIYNTSSNLASHSYSWDFGDGTTGSGRTPSHQYLSFGSYVVCLTISDSLQNCTSTFCDTVGMDSLGNLKTGFGITVQNAVAVGIDEVDQLSGISLYPNPATKQVSVDLRNVQGNVNIKFLDLSGKVVMDRMNTLSGNIESFNISKLTNGFYFMIVDDGQNRKVEKFIKSE